MRDIKVTKDFINSENTSVLYESGNTKVLITVSIADKVPRWLENSDKGWLTAEYNMLPGSSDQRISRKSFEGGRSKEISRLIGRSLRSVCDLAILNGFLVTVDCDVLDADGGTRTASINGAWIALNETFNNLVEQKKLVQNPLTNQIAALSVGIVDGEFIADLDYEKDSSAEVDLNLVLNDNFEILETCWTISTNIGNAFFKTKFQKCAEEAIWSILEHFENNMSVPTKFRTFWTCFLIHLAQDCM